MKKKFWMLYAEGGRAPSFVHDSFESAEKEAKRLAAESNLRIYILEAVKSVKKIVPEIQYSIEDCTVD